MPIVLDGDIAERVNGAFANGTPVLVAYVDGDGFAHLSYRGTTQVFSPTQLAMWARNPDGGLPTNVVERPNITLMYRDPATRTTFFFYGRATLATDDDTRNRVFDNSPEFERNMDPERNGAAIVIEVDRVDGRGADGPVAMRRD